MCAGLTFFDLGEAPQDTFQRLSALFFIMLLFELLPFCYMSFYVADRQCALLPVSPGASCTCMCGCTSRLGNTRLTCHEARKVHTTLHGK